MADTAAAPAAAPAAPAAPDAHTAPATTAEDNPLAVETLLAQLQALPDVKKPTTTLRSKFIKHFKLLNKLNP